MVRNNLIPNFDAVKPESYRTPPNHSRTKGAFLQRLASVPPVIVDGSGSSDFANRVGKGLVDFEGIVVRSRRKMTVVRQMHSMP